MELIATPVSKPGWLHGTQRAETYPRNPVVRLIRDPDQHLHFIKCSLPQV